MSDAAPLLAARELGLFEKHGLAVDLSREVGWATIRDKIVYRELDAAQAPAGMLFATHIGIGCPPTDVLTSFVLNIHGNAITISNQIAPEIIHDPSSFQSEARQRRGEDRLTFGVVSRWSSHHLQLRDWLARSGIDPGKDVRIAVVPPGQMCRNLSAGTIDGFCAGEPWNTLAVREKKGRIVSCSAIDDTGHIEKVLMVHRDFAERQPKQNNRLISALLESCKWCDQPENRNDLVRILAESRSLNLTPGIISPGLVGPLDCGNGETIERSDFFVFHRDGTNIPSPAHGELLLGELSSARLIPEEAAKDTRITEQLFRLDLFQNAATTSDSGPDN